MISSDQKEIKRKSISGIRWSIVQTFVIAIIGPLTQIIKARFLSHHELGIVAIFLIIYGFLQTFENAGISQTIVQKTDLSPSDKFTFLMVASIIGLFGAAILILFSETIEKLTNVPGASNLLIFSGPLFCFALFDQYFRSLLLREMLFRDVAVIEMVKRTVNAVLLLTFLLIFRNPIAVVYSLLVSTALSTVILIITVLKHQLLTLKFEFKAASLTYFLSFGGPIIGKHMFSYFAHRADEMIIAVSLSSETLGIYSFAKETLQKISSLIVSVFARILLPLFTRIKSDRALLAQTYAQITLVVAYFGFSIFIGLAVISNSLIPAAFGSDMLVAIPIFQYLSVALLPIVVTANLSSSLLYAVGKSLSVFVVDIMINIPYLAILFFIGSKGLEYILFSYVTYCFIKGIVLQVLCNKQLSLLPKQHIYIYLRVLLRIAFMVLCSLFFQYIFKDVFTIQIMAMMNIFIGVISVICIVWLTDRKSLQLIIKIIKK
ncbi:MAG: oligosaccharide flippase family protein [Candidatus Thermoplasmatota archaeon]|nr:oligosaccharide flippase family protein [Candidatus Thermoplasmatota archaeon]